MASLLSAATKAHKRSADAISGNEDENAEGGLMSAGQSSAKKIKQRVLLISSRGITQRMRHFMADCEALMPHCKKDSKLSASTSLSTLNELADLANCNNVMFFQTKHHAQTSDLYLWASKTPNGPSAKFHVQNLHTMDELKLTGNCLKGSRPMLSFSKEFDSSEEWKLLREMFTQMFGVPKGARRSKPFFDHVITFSILDNKVWFRNYQIIEKDPSVIVKTKKEVVPPTLVEIGPRFVMTPIRIFEGSFGGPTVFENAEYVAPTAARRAEKQLLGDKYKYRKESEASRTLKMQSRKNHGVDPELSSKAVFA